MKLNGNTIFAALLFLGSAPAAFADNGPPGCYTITECTQVCDSKGTCTQRCTTTKFCNADELPPEAVPETNNGPDLGNLPLITTVESGTAGGAGLKEADKPGKDPGTITPVESGPGASAPEKIVHPGATITTVE